MKDFLDLIFHQCRIQESYNIVKSEFYWLALLESTVVCWAACRYCVRLEKYFCCVVAYVLMIVYNKQCPAPWVNSNLARLFLYTTSELSFSLDRTTITYNRQLTIGGLVLIEVQDDRQRELARTCEKKTNVISQIHESLWKPLMCLACSYLNRCIEVIYDLCIARWTEWIIRQVS